MRFSNVFSVIAVYTLFATVSAATVHTDLSGRKAELDGVAHVWTVRAEPPAVVNDIKTIINDGSKLGKHIAKLIKELQSNPAAAAQPNAEQILVDAAKVAQDVTVLVNDISTLAKDAGVKA